MRSRYTILTSAILAFAYSDLAWGNIRAPRDEPHVPSSSLYPPKSHIEVLTENLVFECSVRCSVLATYTVKSKEPQELSLEFILPVSQSVSVQIGGDAQPVQVVEAEPLTDEDARLDLSARTGRFHSRRTLPLYRAAFEAHLERGTQKIRVSYEQPLGSYERDYGYFSKEGRFVHTFAYELWPLKEWKLAPSFHLDIVVRLQRVADQGFWERLFGEERSIACRGGGAGAATMQTAHRREEEAAMVTYLISLKREFPDRIQCFLGDSDLVESYE